MASGSRPLILVTNDDGYTSAGIIELAYHLYDLGDILFVAPQEHHSGVGRSIPFGATSTDTYGNNCSGFGEIKVTTLDLGDRKIINTYAVNGTPALSAAHGCIEIADRLPDLCISGINYGENVGRALNYSGTIGAAIEAADFGVPSIAISLELNFHDMFYLKGDRTVFTNAAKIAKKFAQAVLHEDIKDDFYCINVNVPSDANEDTPIELVDQSSLNRWHWKKPEPRDYEEPFSLGYGQDDDIQWQPGTDIHSLVVKRRVTVTPITWSIQDYKRENASVLPSLVGLVEQP